MKIGFGPDWWGRNVFMVAAKDDFLSLVKTKDKDNTTIQSVTSSS